MGADEIVPALEKVDLFQGLDHKVVRRLAEAGRVESFSPDETVLARGEPVSGWRAFSPKGVEFHVVLTGTATVILNGAHHGDLGPGDYFGELSLIDGEPRSADIVASTDGLTTFAISKWQFEELLEQHPQIAIPMLRVLTARLRAAEQAAGS
jgi:CRP/FNR family cyclic AMP-dependent transcriptional regulator